MNIFMSVIKDMISEDNEYKRIKSEKLIQEIKEKRGSIPQNVKEYIEKVGIKGWKNSVKFTNPTFPTQFYVYDINIFTDYLYQGSLNYSTGISYLTFKDALKEVYSLINQYIKDNPDSKIYIESENKIDSETYEEYKITLVERFKNIGYISRTYSIDRTLVTIFPYNDFIIGKDGGTFYEL